MQIDTTKIQGEVYATSAKGDILYVKVTIPSLQMYINSCTIRPSPNYGGLWFQMPKFLVGKKWMEPIEFKGSSSFRDLMVDEAMRAADRYIQDKKLQDIFPGAMPVNQDEVVDVAF